MNDTLDASAILTMDAGKNRLFMIHHYQPRELGTMIVPGGIAGMGWAPPAAVAAKILHPERTCVSVSSDGGFAMSLHVLSTALQYRAPTIFVVMNDSALGWVRDDRLDRPGDRGIHRHQFRRYRAGLRLSGYPRGEAAGYRSGHRKSENGQRADGDRCGGEPEREL